MVFQGFMLNILIFSLISGLQVLFFLNLLDKKTLIVLIFIQEILVYVVLNFVYLKIPIMMTDGMGEPFSKEKDPESEVNYNDIEERPKMMKKLILGNKIAFIFVLIYLAKKYIEEAMTVYF